MEMPVGISLGGSSVAGVGDLGLYEQLMDFIRKLVFSEKVIQVFTFESRCLMKKFNSR